MTNIVCNPYADTWATTVSTAWPGQQFLHPFDFSPIKPLWPRFEIEIPWWLDRLELALSKGRAPLSVMLDWLCGLFRPRPDPAVVDGVGVVPEVVVRPRYRRAIRHKTPLRNFRKMAA